MHRCIRLVRIAKERGESPVGVVVMRHGEVIAEDIEAAKARQDITRHAEVEARWSPISPSKAALNRAGRSSP